MQQKLFRSMVLAGFGIVSLAFSSAAFAQTPDSVPGVRVSQQPEVPVVGDFMMGPTRFTLPMQGGEQRTVTIELTNRQGEPVTYSLSVEDFSAGDNANEPTKLYGKQPGPFPARDWVKPAVAHITLQHGERASIPVTVHLSANADAGDHYAAVIVQRDTGSEPNQGVSVISRVGSLFIVQVAGEITQEGSIDRLQSDRALYWTYPIKLSLTATNKGTIHMEPEGTVRIRNLFGFVVDEIPVKDWIILRNSSRTSELDWKPTFALGRYTAETNLQSFGSALPPVSTSFWVLPALPVIIVLIAIFLVSFLVQYAFSHFEIRRK